MNKHIDCIICNC